MKKLLSLLITVLFLSTAQAWANHGNHDHSGDTAGKAVPGIEGAACKDKVNIKVNGMVCDFCARALEKVFSKREEVSGIKVDLDKSLVTVAMKSGKTIDNDELTKLITDSGYEVREIGKGC